MKDEVIHEGRGEGCRAGKLTTVADWPQPHQLPREGGYSVTRKGKNPTDLNYFDISMAFESRRLRGSVLFRNLLSGSRRHSKHEVL